MFPFSFFSSFSIFLLSFLFFFFSYFLFFSPSPKSTHQPAYPITSHLPVTDNGYGQGGGIPDPYQQQQQYGGGYGGPAYGGGYGGQGGGYY